MGSLLIDYATLRREIGRFLGIGRDPTAWTADNISDVSDILRAGLRSFYWPPPLQQGAMRHAWSFLFTKGTISATANVADYDLPADCTGIIRGAVTQLGVVAIKAIAIPEDEIRALRSNASLTGSVRYFAVLPKTFTGTTGTRYEIMLYPTPVGSVTLEYSYSFEPVELDIANLYHAGGAEHSEAVLEACLAAAEKTLNDERGIHRALFMDCLSACVQLDMNRESGVEHDVAS